MKYVDIVFDGPPGPTAGRFVEVENEQGKSINFGEWIKREDDYWALRITSPEAQAAEIERLTADCEMKDKRIDWTVADNVKKAIRIAELESKINSIGLDRCNCPVRYVLHEKTCPALGGEDVPD